MASLVTLMLAAACSPQGASQASESPAPTAQPSTSVATVETGPATTTPTTTTTTTTTGPSTDPATTPSPSTTESPQPPPLDRSDSVAIERMQSDIVTHLLDQPRVGGSEAEAATITVLASTIEDITGTSAVVDPVPLPTGETSANVWAPPIGNGDAVLMLGAHIDSVDVAPGVDDNGSGTVVLLELLRRITDSPPPAVTVVVVFFGAEEVLPGYGRNDHHFGSRLAAAQLAAEATLPTWMVSVDMVGMGERLVAVSYEDEDPAVVAAIASAAETVGVDVTRLSRGDISDHEAFARAGTPAAMMWRPDNAAWHTAEDTSVDPERLLEDLLVLEALIAHLAGQGANSPSNAAP